MCVDIFVSAQPTGAAKLQCDNAGLKILIKLVSVQKMFSPHFFVKVRISLWNSTQKAANP